MAKKEETYQVYGKHVLSGEELAEKSREIAETLNALQAKEVEKKAVMSQIAAEINDLKGKVHRLGGHIRDGFEMRLMPCTIERNFITKKKHFVSVDTGEVVKTEALTAEDMQLEM